MIYTPDEQPQSAPLLLQPTAQTRELAPSPVKPEWWQAVTQLYLIALIFVTNLNPVQFIVIGLYYLLLLLQGKRLQPTKVDLPPVKAARSFTPEAGWYLLTTWVLAIGVAWFTTGYLWRLPAATAYCLLLILLVYTGHYRVLPPKAAAPKSRQDKIVSWLVLAGLVAALLIGISTLGTVWPFVLYCVVATTVILATRPKPEQAALA